MPWSKVVLQGSLGGGGLLCFQSSESTAVAVSSHSTDDPIYFGARVFASEWLAYGCGFFLACEDFGKMFEHLFPACGFFLVCFVCFFEVEISSRTLIPIFRSGSVHSG